MRTLLQLLAAIAVVLAARAAPVAMTILPGQGPLVAGQVIALDVVVLNPGAGDQAFNVESVLPGSLSLNGRTYPVSLGCTGPAPVAVPAGGFVARSYEFRLPNELSGEAVLTVTPTTAPAMRTVLTIAAAEAGASAASRPEAATPLVRLGASAPAISAVSRNFTGRFLPNLPVYFIYGGGDQAAKFQFSFDYRLATLGTADADDSHDERTIRVGYTQRSLWDIDGRSSPFYDTSYMPEIAFNSDRRMPRVGSNVFTWLGWRASLHHESNGKDGNDSRSVNTVYFRPRFILGELGGWAFVMLPEFQAYLGDTADNADLKDYRGYGKLRFYFGHNERPTLMFTSWAGKDFDHGSYQFDLAVPLKLKWLRLESYLYAQYFHGYGESLRDYRRRSEAFRAGFGLVR